MAFVTASWNPLGEAFYRKLELYEMSWSIRDGLRDSLVAAAPYGGPIALLREPLRHSPSSRPQLEIYSASGIAITSFPWKSGPVVHLGWSVSDELLCVQEDGSVLIYDLFGSFKRHFSMGQEVVQSQVLEAKVFHSPYGTGIAIVTGSSRFTLATNIEDLKLRRLPEVPGLQGKPASWVVLTQDRQTKVLLSIGPELYILDNTSCTAVCPPGLSPHAGSIVHMSVSFSYKYLSLFTDSGHLWAGLSNLQEKLIEFDTKKTDRPKQMLWCRRPKSQQPSVVLMWERLLLVVGECNDTIQFPVVDVSFLVGELDGVRIINSTNQELLQEVPLVCQDIFKIASMAPGALLLEAHREYEKSSQKADEYLREIKEQNVLEKAVQQCVEAAAHEYDPATQKSLMRAASFGKCFLTDFCSDHFVSTCRELRVLNAVRESSVGMPLTHTQFKQMTLQVLIDRLLFRQFYPLAIEICRYLKIPDYQGVNRVLKHWASCKVQQKELSDDAIARAVCVKVGESPGVSYSHIAAKAYECGRTELAIKLLDFEPRSGEQVPLLLKMKRSHLALNKAVESGDTDLVYMVVTHLKNEMNRGDFFMTLRNQPVALSLYRQFCKLQEQETLKDLYNQDDNHQELANYYVTVSYREKRLESRLSQLQNAVDEYNKAKNDFAAKATEEEMRLLRFQRKLDDEKGAGLLGLSLQHVVWFQVTMETLLSLGLHKQAEQLYRDFKVPDKRYWWLKLKSLAEKEEWGELAAGMEHVSVINPGEGLEARPVDDTLFACPLCPKQKATTWRRIQGHFEGHVNTAFRFEDKIICRCSMPCRDAAHYHCPLCWTTIIRKEQMRFHIKFCRRKTTPLTFVPAYNMPPHKRDHDYSWLPPTPNDSDRSPQRPSAPSSPEVAPPDDHDPPQPTSTSCDSTTGPEELVRPKAFPTQTLKRAKCPHCGLLLYKKNLAAHVQRKHTQKKEKPALKSVCIDRANGIFAVRKAFSHGFSTPVHVQRKTGEQQQTTCELRECRELLMLAQRSGLTPTECEHIRSLQFSCDSAAEEPLQADVLDEMVSLNLFGAAAANDCKDRQKAAQEAGVPLSVPVNFGGSPRQICVSVHEPKTLYYSVLGRVIVTYKTLRNTWHCPCAKPHKSCPHKNIARWHLFQTRKHLFTPPSQTEENSEAPPSPDRSSSEDLEKSVRYVYEKKKIPADLQGDANAVKAPTENPEKLLPVETVCPLCSDEPPLTDAFLVTDAAMVVGMAGLGRNVSTYNKRCSCCGGVYRYQEWRDGLHNFNDRVLLTLELCFYLRINLQSHVSVSACVTCLEKLHGKKFPPADTILRAYLHFEALSSTEYAYACVNCGPSPPVVVLERHRKAVCNLEVSELRTPSEDYDGQQNISDFWDAINLDMISRGFFPKSSTNPFVVKPSYENWAPWIGKQTRKSDSVFNTEYKKITQDQTEADLSEAAEDRLFDILLQQQTWTIRKLCRTCNVDTTGSRLDLIKRLQEKMEIRQTHDKVLQSLWGASGGWSVVLCPHGVVYALKLNLRNESPRDFADLLLSWKHFPNICLYDFAHDLVTHTNLRTVDDPVFQPDEGKLAEPTPENLQEAARGKLRVSLPWLAEKSNLPDENAHPVTGSNQRYVLYDKFHEADPDDPEEVLRSVNLVPEIPGSVNGPAAEQLFSDMRKNDDFLNIMAPSTHVFLMRNIIQHRNTESNRKLVARQLKRGRHGVFQLKRLKVK